MLTWTASKRKANLAKHGRDFVGCETIFDGPVVAWDDDRESYGEQRINLLGWLRGRVMHMTYVDDGSRFHVISLRDVDKHEVRRYAQEIAR